MSGYVIANLPPKYRSAMHTIQLAVLAKVTDLQKYGYAAILAPFVRDVHTLEQDGVFIESLGQNVKGTIFCVSADNLAAHGLGGFLESFKAQYVCRFCMARSEQFCYVPCFCFALSLSPPPGECSGSTSTGTAEATLQSGCGQ